MHGGPGRELVTGGQQRDQLVPGSVSGKFVRGHVPIGSLDCVADLQHCAVLTACLPHDSHE